MIASRRERGGGRLATTSRHWVVIETGSNQDLIFKTNKQRLNVAASRLIWSVGFEWIPEAIAEVVASGERVDHVVKASGLAVFIASPEAGRHVIEKVTTRAIHEAPELDIWGVVGSDDIADESGELAQTGLGRALGRAQRSSAGWRQRRPSPAMRDPNFPHTQVCAFTGRPATRRVGGGANCCQPLAGVSADFHKRHGRGQERSSVVGKPLQSENIQHSSE